MVLVAVVVLMTACSSRAHRSAPTPSFTAAATRYLELAATANASIDAAKSRLRTGTEDLSTTESELRSIADAKRAFDMGLEALHLGAPVGKAVQSLLDADAELERRLDAGAQAASPTELASMSPGILSAGQSCVASAATLRHLLGLPPLS